jgi:hypothetical protein
VVPVAFSAAFCAAENRAVGVNRELKLGETFANGAND